MGFFKILHMIKWRSLFSLQIKDFDQPKSISQDSKPSRAFFFETIDPKITKEKVYLLLTESGTLPLFLNLSVWF